MVAPPRGAGDPYALRRLNAPRPIDVRLDSTSAPVALQRNGRWLNVIELLDRYRTDDRWWTEQPISRTYYELLLEDDRIVAIFHDEIEESWFLQRYG